jgi:ABC-type polysaccharide/polyol phosphate export permease
MNNRPTIDAGPSTRPPASTAAGDLVTGLTKFELWGRIGWLDVKRRYRRTMIGPFWSSLTLAFYTVAVGLVGGGLFKQDISYYLPYLSAGMIVWTLISTIIMESCTLFVQGNALFKNVRFEYSVLAYALVWRNFIIFCHNMIIFIIIALVLQPQLLGLKLIYVIPGLFIILMNGVWIALLIGLLCLRYRDAQPLVQTFIQICMLVTPIFWIADNLAGTLRYVFVQFNPIYRLIDIVRGPLLGQVPTAASYMAALSITVVGWCLAFVLFQRFRKRISYWS